MSPKKTALLSLRVILGALFAVSGFQKLASPWQNFAAVIEQYQIIQGPAAQIAAQTIPWVEFIAGVFFAAGLHRRLSLGALWTMNTLFIGALGSALLRKLPLDSCGCFGDAFKVPPSAMLGIDVFLWGLFLVIFLSSRR